MLRGFVIGAAALWVACVRPPDAVAQAVAQPAVVQTVDQFIDTIGVAAHVSAARTPYTNVPGLIAALGAIGVHQLRTDASYAKLADLQALCAAGIRFDLMMVQTQTLALPRALGAPCLRAVEGDNEINLPQNRFSFGALAGLAAVQAHQAAIFAEAHATLPGVDVVIASNGLGYPVLGGVSMQGAATLGNVHAYGQFGIPPDGYAAAEIAAQRATAPGKPFVITETGFSTTGPHALTELAQGILVVSAVLDTARLGAQATYLYQLVDSCSDSGNIECGFGLFGAGPGATFVPKKAARMLGLLTGLLRYDISHGRLPMPVNPAPLGLVVTGLVAGQHMLQLAYPSGTFLLIWDEAVGPPRGYWDDAAHAARFPLPANTATIRLTGAPAYMMRQDLTVGTASVGTPGPAQSFTVPLGNGHPMLITIRRAG